MTSKYKSRKSRNFQIGAVIQGLLLGTGLTIAVAELVSSEFGATIFRYQAF